MSLLKKASIITTPTAYAEDYLYSIKPAIPFGENLDVLPSSDSAVGNHYKFTPYGNNTVQYVNGETIISYVDNSSAAYHYFQTGYNTSQNLTVGKYYKVEITFKINTGSVNLQYSDGSNTPNLGEYTNTDYKTVSYSYTALSATVSWVRFIGFGSGEVVTVKKITIQEATDADFDFDRNSTGTRVNEDYLIEDVPYNLATYSESINNWTTTNSPTVTTNIAIAPDGTLTADGLQDTTGSNFKRVRTNISVSANSTFTGSCFIKKVSSETGNTGFALVFTGTSTKVAYGIIDSVNGTMVSQSSTITPVFKIESANNDYWRFSMTATDTGSNTSLEFSIYGTLSSNGTSVSAGAGSLRTIWGAQLVKGDQPKDYLKTTDRLDIPRIDYTNGEPSILLEPSRTNLVTYSQDLSQWTLVNGTLTANATVSPEGIQNAGKVAFSSVSLDLKRTITVVAGTTYTISFYIKVEDGTGLQGRFYDNSNSANIESYNYDDQIIPNQWSRITRSVTAPSGCTEMQIWLLAGSSTLVTASWWGAQFEAGSYPTSLIHTSGSTVTRSADAANNAGNSDLINSTEGVLYAEMKALANDSTNRNITLSDGTTTNRIVLKYDNSSNVIQCFNRVAGVETASLTNTVVDITEFKKIAVKYKVNDYALYIDGKEVDTDTTSTTFSASTLNDLSLTPDLHAQVKSIMVFKEALSDEELECLTGYNNHELYMNYYNRLSYLGLAEEYNVESDINNYIL